jgi:SAM-dependent methyltransferase
MTGSGPGAITPDGCAVEVYSLLPVMGEPEIIHGAIRTGGSLLDLGCGVGRLAHPLVELGHPVVAVDESPEMLARVRDAETVLSGIAGLRLDRRFDAVLLASHLINTPDRGARDALLATAAAHLADDGVLVAQWHPPEWFDTVRSGSGGAAGPIRAGVHGVRREGDLVHATVDYSAGDRRWQQEFTARRLTKDDLDGALARAGLTFRDWCTPDHVWFTAVAA